MGTPQVVTTIESTVAPNTSWTEPRTVYSVYDDGYIPKLLSNRCECQAGIAQIDCSSEQFESRVGMGWGRMRDAGATQLWRAGSRGGDENGGAAFKRPDG